MGCSLNVPGVLTREIQILLFRIPSMYKTRPDTRCSDVEKPQAKIHRITENHPQESNK